MIRLSFLESRLKVGLQSTVLDDVKTKHLIWYGHVQRMADNRWLK
jgi:hypothetical protein